jgi:hypothetical protein
MSSPVAIDIVNVPSESPTMLTGSTLSDDAIGLDTNPIRQPCDFPGGCLDRCPYFDYDSGSPNRCASCGHLRSHHRAVVLPAAITPTTAPSLVVSDSPFCLITSDLTVSITLQTTPTTHAPIGDRFRSFLNSSRQRRLVSAPSPSVSTSQAQAEVRTGFRPSSPAPLGRHLKGKLPAKLKGVAGQCKGKGKTENAEKVEIRGIYFIPEASDHLNEVC